MDNGMVDDSHRVYSEVSILHSENEEKWRSLRRQIELADSFWLGFIFSSSPHTVAVFRRRFEQILNFRVQRMRVIRPETPNELRSALHRVFEPESAQANCVWIESIHSASSVQGKNGRDPWCLAWDHFLLRTNEHRDAARRHLCGSLILVAPPQVKSRARDAAPDLWSIRSLVLDLTPRNAIAGGGAVRETLEAQRTLGSTENEASDVPVDIDFVVAEIERLFRIIGDNRQFNPDGLVRALGRAVAGQLDKGKTTAAAELSRKVVGLLRDRPARIRSACRGAHVVERSNASRRGYRHFR